LSSLRSLRGIACSRLRAARRLRLRSRSSERPVLPALSDRTK
jgi:hypothetical protein